MKITYLNPENAPVPQDGWRWKTALCKPETINDWRMWLPSDSTYIPGTNGNTTQFSYITQADLPADYYFDLDGTGLSFEDPFYRRGVEKAAKEGKTIQNLRTCGQWVDCISPAHYLAFDACLRIHPRHANDYGLEVPGDNEPTIPANLPPFPESPWNKHHWEHRGFAWKANGTRIIALVKPGENSWGVIKAEPRGAKVFYAELVPDAPANQPDLDSPDYWSEKQPEVRLQWAQNPAIAREYWESADNSWKCLEHTNWYDFAIYRPRPVALTDEQRDERDFEEWVSTIQKVPESCVPLKQVFLAGRSTLREQQKGGAK